MRTGVDTVSHARKVSFATTLVVMLALAAMLFSRTRESSESSAAAYGVLLLVLAPVSAYVTSRRVAPWVSQLSWPVSAPRGGTTVLNVGFAALVFGCYRYWLHMVDGGGSASGLVAWLLVVVLAPPVYLGCLAYLWSAARASR